MPKIPPNTFGAAFGLSGLAGAWSTAANHGLVPGGIGRALLVLAAVIWLVTLVAYLIGGSVRTDLVHPIFAPFVSLAVITPILLSAGLHPYAPSLSTVLTDTFIALAVVHGAWFTGQLIYAEFAIDQLHPGYFLPTVAGGLVAATSAAQIGQHALGRVMFGYGMVCWLVLGSIILARLFFRPALPTLLLPTLAIEVAPAAVASLAWFALNGGVIDMMAQFLAGYGVLMALAQLRLLPLFVRLKFSIGFWAFTFAWAAVASALLHWVTNDVLAWLILIAITALVGAIAVRSLMALAKGTLFPAK
ncbi:hypothetical protein [Kribbella sandramycini]|uniref:Tellurite resistance protein n=1 Tax=Kribbella sandramycini TaxID=60450 RepID=A0A841SF99_9ACTN|nr:tellurite resistance protein [Kribbella sandramycini]